MTSEVLQGTVGDYLQPGYGPTKSRAVDVSQITWFACFGL